jgi:hypothetical protein
MIEQLIEIETLEIIQNITPENKKKFIRISRIFIDDCNKRYKNFKIALSSEHINLQADTFRVLIIKTVIYHRTENSSIYSYQYFSCKIFVINVKNLIQNGSKNRRSNLKENKIK